ncbi:MAG TPA: PadR family transcriptional regulator, partial [Feifaniaceae bacterium]|nr:PadR family transcriptional regulator [Feifaniaceae bacterium]
DRCNTHYNVKYNIGYGDVDMEREEILSGLILELRRGSIVLAVLSQLQKPMYGYHLVTVMGESGVAVEVNTLYPLLRRLESQGLLESEWETGGAKPRKYYVLTEFGNEIYRVLKKHWDETVASMNRLMEGEQ